MGILDIFEALKRGRARRRRGEKERDGTEDAKRAVMLLGSDGLEAQQGIYLKSPVRNPETFSKSD